MAYLTPAQIRDRCPDLANTDLYPDATLSRYESVFEGIAERARGVAFTTRTTTETVTLDGEQILHTRWPAIQSVTSVTVTLYGSTVTLASTRIQVQSTGDIDLQAAFTGLATVVYVHGIDPAPDPILDACAEYVRSRAITSKAGNIRDVIAQAFDGGTTRYSTPDWDAGRYTGLLDVDALINSVPDYRRQGIG